jgi:signal transduction histidine kinase
MFDRDMRYLGSNCRWSNDYRLGDSDLCGLLHYDVFDVPERWKEAYRRGLAGEVLIKEDDRYEWLDGTVQLVRWEIHPWYDALGSINGIVIFSENITEHHKVEEQLLTFNEDLERRVEQRTYELQQTQSQYLHAEKLLVLGKLSASIAHEFNNPLQGVMVILKGLKRRAILEEEDKELLDLAIEENERMKGLIQSLQDFYRPSTENKVAMDVHASIDSSLLLYRNDLKYKKISVVLNYAESLPRIQANPNQIKQAFHNLLSNAMEACQEEGGVITISTRQEEQKVVVAIKDTGTGIMPEKIDRIFQPFFSTKPDVKGIGLGLSVCHGIIQNHQGEIRVESKPGEGSTFTVVLPITGSRLDT